MWKCFNPPVEDFDFGFEPDKVKSKFFQAGLSHDMSGNREDNCTAQVPFLGCLSSGYFGLFEGHRSGWIASRSASLNLHRFLQMEIDSNIGRNGMKKCIEAAFQKMDEHLISSAPDRGTSASVCIVENNEDSCRVYFANTGDTRAILGCSSKAVRLNRDHTPKDESEAKRLQQCQAYVKSDFRVQKLSRLSRALGDHLLKKWVISTPHFSEHQLVPEQDILLLLSRSVAAVINDQEAIDLTNGNFSFLCIQLFFLTTANFSF